MEVLTGSFFSVVKRSAYQLLLFCVESTLCSLLGTAYSSMLAKALKAESKIPFTSHPTDALLPMLQPVTQLLKFTMR